MSATSAADLTWGELGNQCFLSMQPTASCRYILGRLLQVASRVHAPRPLPTPPPRPPCTCPPFPTPLPPPPTPYFAPLTVQCTEAPLTGRQLVNQKLGLVNGGGAMYKKVDQE